MPLSLALQLCLGRLGSAVNTLVSPRVARQSGLVAAAGTSVAFCVISLAICYVIGWHIGTRPAYGRSIRFDDGQLLAEDRRPAASFAVLCRRWIDYARLKTKSFPAKYWVLCGVCFTLYGSIIPFQAIAAEYLEHTFFRGDFVRAAASMRFLLFFEFKELE